MMKDNKNKRTRFTAAMLASVMMFSMASQTVSFAKVNDSEIRNVKEFKYNGDTVFYSDDYFRHPGTEYDPHLATVSVIMTDKTCPRRGEKTVINEKWYHDQPNLLEGYMNELGFTDFDTNEDYRKRTEFDTIGLAAASRKIDDCTVIAATIRSGGYYREWGNNVWLGDGSKSDYMHEGWYNAARKMLAFLDSYVTERNITGKVKIWITGFSRGGATANLTAGLLDNMIDRNEQIFTTGASLAHDDLYAYTFEAPQGANYNSVTVKKPGDRIYNNIWNIVNPNDLVTKVAMSGYGFTRFGTDRYITTKFYDPDKFTNNRNTFKALYQMNGQTVSEYKADNFDMYGTPIEKLGPLAAAMVTAAPGAIVYVIDEFRKGNNPILEKDKTKANYDANIATTVLIEELTRNIGSRRDYCNKYQEGVKNLLLALENDQNDAKKDELLYIGSRILLAGLANAATGIASPLRKAVGTICGTTDQADAIIDTISPLFKTMLSVYWERPNEMISLIMYIKEVFQNHDSNVNIAHLEAQDSFYINKYNASGKGKINLVSLRDNADFGRLMFKDFNDIGLYVETGNGLKNVINVNGKLNGKSNISRCNAGYAVGYYSYATEEKMEVFTPVNKKFVINMKGFSKKPVHTATYQALYQHIGSNSKRLVTENRGNFSDWYVFNTAFVQKGVNMIA